MAITPDTNLKLLKCNLNLDEMNQINFSNATNQYNYFNGLTKLEASNFTYQRKDGVIRYPAHIDSIMEYNYVMYQNHNYGNKWFYAYIVKMEYINDNMTNIYIKTDPYQTWQFDITFMKSFVEREHVNSDTIGLHTIPEGLETGEFITNGDPVNIFEYSSSGGGSVAGTNSYVVIVATDWPDTAPSSFNKVINGVFNGCIYLVATGSTSAEVASKVDEILGMYAGKLEYIQSMFMIPKTLLYFNNTTQINALVYGGHTLAYIKPSDSAYEFISPVTISINSTINGYTPKNNKLFTREFNNIILSNNCGSDVVMAYEDFTSNTPKFTCLGSITPGCSIKCVPLNYRLLADSSSYKSYDYGITGAKFPVCSWAGDTFTNWLTQNGVNIGLQTAGSLIATGVGIATANPIAISSGVLGVLNTAGQVYQHSIVPEQTYGNINSGDVTWSSGKSMFTVYKTCIRQEYAKVIDGFFSAYGYKVNEFKIPNITGRRNWNYVKCIDVNIEGYIPQEDLNEIKGMFNNGVTIWHNASTFLDYSQNNDII